MNHLVDTVKDKYLTWRTGKDKTTRDWEKWRDENIVYNAHDVQNYYRNFKHIIQVDPKKFWNYSDPFGWVPVDDFLKYEYPQKQLGDNAVANWFRGEWGMWDKRFHIDDCFGTDHVFVATNNDEDAVMIALIYS